MISEEREDAQSIRVGIRIISHDRPGQFEKYLQVLQDLNIHFTRAEAHVSVWNGKFICKIVLTVADFQELSTFFERVEQIDGVVRVERLFWMRKFFFVLAIFLSFFIWASHPYVLYLVTHNVVADQYPLISSFFLYSSLALLFFMIFSLKRLTRRSFPELRETKTLWVMTFVLNIFALMTFFAEIFFLQIQFNWIMAFSLILLILSYLTSEYIYYRDRYLASHLK